VSVSGYRAVVYTVIVILLFYQDLHDVGGKIEGLGFGRSIKIGLWMGKDSAWMEKEKDALIDEAKPDQVIEGSKHHDVHDLFDIYDR
jgi:hypothetical protein